MSLVSQFSLYGLDKEGPLDNCLENFRRKLRPLKTVWSLLWKLLPSYLGPKFRVIVGPGSAAGASHLPIGLYLF